MERPAAPDGAGMGTRGARRGRDAVSVGKEDDPKRANVLDNPTLVNHGLMPVRSFAKLPEYQMAGNAWEMIDSPATPPSSNRKQHWIQIRGGSYNTPLSAAVTFEYRSIPESFSGPDIGFRCAKSFP